jgi:hypothetical protein
MKTDEADSQIQINCGENFGRKKTSQQDLHYANTLMSTPAIRDREPEERLSVVPSTDTLLD